MRILLQAFGLLFLLLGVVGIFVPLLPTTPFVLLAAWCFARSSQAFHQWLLDHKTFGPAIAAWRSRGAIPVRAKWIACGSLAASIAVIAIQVKIVPVAASVIVMLLCIGAYIVSRPS